MVQLGRLKATQPGLWNKNSAGGLKVTKVPGNKHLRKRSQKWQKYQAKCIVGTKPQVTKVPSNVYLRNQFTEAKLHCAMQFCTVRVHVGVGGKGLLHPFALISPIYLALVILLISAIRQCN